MAPRIVGRIVGGALAEAGVEHVFGVVGNGNLLAVDGFVAGGGTYVAARHEAGAVVMADVYAQALGVVGVCTATYGPGLTNTATPIVEAAKSHTPLLIVTGGAPRAGLRPSDLDQSPFLASLGAAEVRLEAPENAARDTALALRMARVERRPVVLVVPADVLDAVVTADSPTSPPQPDPEPPAAGPAAVRATAEALAGATRPLLIAGHGAWISEAGPTLEALADRVGALLATTLRGNGMFGDSPWAAGISGGFSSPGAAELIKQADVVLVAGAGLKPFTTRFGQFPAPDATVIQVDVAARPTSPRVDRFVRGDVRTTAAAVLAALEAGGLDEGPSWRDAGLGAAVRASSWRHVEYADSGDGEHIDPRTLSIALADLLPERRTIVTDGGHFVGWPSMYWAAPDPAGYLVTGLEFQAIGMGFAAAVGAAVAEPDRTIVLATGDGGALMGISELETLARVAASALVVVYNDAAYGAEVHQFAERDVDLGTARFPDTDFVALARAVGGDGATVRTTDDLAALSHWRDDGAAGIFLLDCKVRPDVVADYLAELLHR
jgi:thiamine pyrophosphate-dependent acetolactate synthase large subunit-like protein